MADYVWDSATQSRLERQVRQSIFSLYLNSKCDLFSYLCIIRRFSVFRNQFLYAYFNDFHQKKLKMAVKENTIHFILLLPKMKTKFVHKKQKVNLQGNIYYTPYFAFLFFVYFLSRYIFFDDMIIKGTKGRTYLYVFVFCFVQWYKSLVSQFRCGKLLYSFGWLLVKGKLLEITDRFEGHARPGTLFDFGNFTFQSLLDNVPNQIVGCIIPKRIIVST